MSVIKDNLHYNPETGLFKWKTAAHGRQLLRPVGTKRKDGYIVIRVNYTLHLAHRLAWFISYGKWPDRELDHINGVRDDNRLSNLRDVSRMENAVNNRGYKKRVYKPRFQKNGGEL